MTKTISSSRSSTLDSLLSTLRNFWESLKPRNARWREVRSDAIAAQREYKRHRKVDREARRDYDIEFERVTYGDGLCVVETLISDLITVLEENPFPGEQRTALCVAVDLFPDAKVMLTPKVFVSGKALWVRVFQEGGITYWDKVYFPVKVDVVDIAKLEQLLWERVREDNTIASEEVVKVIGYDPNSKSYRDTKGKLQARGWTWARKRCKGRLWTVVIPPG